jgi:hypothetical protein
LWHWNNIECILLCTCDYGIYIVKDHFEKYFNLILNFAVLTCEIIVLLTKWKLLKFFCIENSISWIYYFLCVCFKHKYLQFWGMVLLCVSFSVSHLWCDILKKKSPSKKVLFLFHISDYTMVPSQKHFLKNQHNLFCI